MIKIYTLREFPERFAKDRIRFPTSCVQSFWMIGPFDESISCFLIKVDPWVLVPITFRGLRVLIFIPGPSPDIGRRPTVRAHPEREAITRLLCIPAQDFPRAAVKRRVWIMRTNMTTLTWMTLLFSNILPSDHNANLPLQMIAPTRHPVDPKKSNRALGFPALVTGLCSPIGCPFPPARSRHPDIGIAPARHPVDPKKSNKVLELSSSNYGSTECLSPPARASGPLLIELSSRCTASPSRRRAKHHSSLGMADSGQQTHHHHL
ncbi:hypothetical protein HKD37_05G012897 [Glycine soja]